MPNLSLTVGSYQQYKNDVNITKAAKTHKSYFREELAKNKNKLKKLWKV